MNKATKRSILRWIHLIFTIPILGYIYEPPTQVAQYVGGARFIFIPILILSGYWMYAGVIVAIIGLAAWLGTYCLWGFGAAILSQVVLWTARKIWLMTRVRRPKEVIQGTERIPR